LTLDGRIGLNLYRDGRRPATQGGRFGPSEQMRNPGGFEQSVILDRLDGGVGAIERMVPHTYPLAIDGCTRFSRAWTPSGEIIHLPALAAFVGENPARIRAMLTWQDPTNSNLDVLLVGSGSVFYKVEGPNYTLAEPVGMVEPGEEIEDMVIFEGVMLASTTHVASGLPGHLYASMNGDTWISSSAVLGESPPGIPAYRQHLMVTYQVINDVGAYRLIANDSPYTFRFIATGDTATTMANILNDSAWAGSAPGIYTVGDRSARITNMAGSPLVGFFCKEDGVYHIGPDGRSARIADWSDSVHRTNGEVFRFAYGGLYASHVRWGLVRIDVANLQVQWQTNACAPGANLPRVVPSSGQTTAFTMDGEWMVVSIFNGTDSYIFYGRPNEITERVAMINLSSPQALNWHGSEGTFWNKRITYLQQATLGPADRPLLWVGWETINPPTPEHPLGDPSLPPHGTPGLSNISLPKYGTPLEDWIMGGPHRFQPLSWLYYPRQDWGDERGTGPYAGWASVRKVFNRLDLTAEHLFRYHVWIDAYMANQGGPDLFFDRADKELSLWTHVGRFDEGERLSLVPGKSIQSGLKAGLMLRGYGERDKPFAFYGAKLRGTPLLEQSERRQYRVTFGRSRKANQAMDMRERLTVLNEMWALQWADPVTLLDQYHIPMVIDIEPTMSYEDVTEPNTGEPTIVLTFTCRVIRRAFYWGAGYRFGSDVMWS
jgi:hypothetical protein